MKSIRILIYFNRLKAMSDDEYLLRKKAWEGLSKIYENEINSLGGVFSMPIEIIVKNFPIPSDKTNTDLLNYLKTNNNFSVIISAQSSEHIKEIVKHININECLIFAGNAGGYKNFKENLNFFNVSRVVRDSKILTVKKILKEHKRKENIYFLHEGKRYNVDIPPYLKKEKIPYKDYNLSMINETDLNKKISSILKQISSKDLLLLDLSPLKLLSVLNFLNNNDKQPIVLKVYGLIDGRIDKYNFPMIEVSGIRGNNRLTFLSLCDQLDKNFSSNQREIIGSGIFRFEIALLLAYASRKDNTKVKNKLEFCSVIRRKIHEVDGINDIFIGKANTYSFKDNENTNKSSFNYLMPQSLQKDGEVHRIYYPIQFFPKKDKFVKVDVNYAYIDIIRITNVDIGKSIWSCEFFLDVISIHKNPLEIIKFNNLSLIDSKFEIKLVEQSKDEQFGGTNYRYYIVANFDFFAIADNYPFDWQHIYISMSISNEEKYGILQPTPDSLIDKEFQLDGWHLEDAKTGVLRKKETHNKNVTLEQVLKIREEIRVGWTISRTNAVTTMKVAIPIIFLMFLNYYTFFLTIKDLSSSIGILTTTFLSGIALYFSTEKPQPLRMTTIDLIFIYYYIQIGISVVVTAVAGFTNETLFSYSMIGMKFLLPISIIVALILLFQRIKSVRLRPRIDA